MIKSTLTLFALFLSLFFNAQSALEKEKLISNGVALHDKGDYAGAIAYYDQVLEKEPFDVLAGAEKTFSLYMLGKYEDALELGRKIIDNNQESEDLKTLYVTYANSLDHAGKPDEALAAYDEGIQKFPDFYHLYFNKGITEARQEKYPESILSFEKSISLNPDHGSSHNALGRMLITDNLKIPSILALCRFMVIEPEGERAKGNIDLIKKIMASNVEKTGKNSVTINFNPADLPDSTQKGKIENDFSTTYLILTLSAALDNEKKNKKKNQAEIFYLKMETLCSSLAEGEEEGFGFYWDYYAPYFIEMNDKKFLETYCYIAHASLGDKKINQWLSENSKEVVAFYQWSKNYTWKK